MQGQEKSLSVSAASGQRFPRYDPWKVFTTAALEKWEGRTSFLEVFISIPVRKHTVLQ